MPDSSSKRKKSNKATAVSGLGRPYSPGWLTDRKARLDAITHDPEAMAAIMARVADGEHLAAICREYDVAYQAVREFIDSTTPLREAYERAVAASGELRIERILRSVEEISDIGIDELYAEDGSLLPLSQMSDRAKRAISGIKTTELTDKDGSVIGVARDVKLYDKLKAKELLGKHARMFGEGSAAGGGKSGVTVVVNRGCGQEQKDGITIAAGGQEITVG